MMIVMISLSLSLSLSVISTCELGMVGLAAASVCSRLANTGAAVIHAYSASPRTPSTIFVSLQFDALASSRSQCGAFRRIVCCRWLDQRRSGA